MNAERCQTLVELVTMMGDNGELPIANALANVVHTNYLVSSAEYKFIQTAIDGFDRDFRTFRTLTRLGYFRPKF